MFMLTLWLRLHKNHGQRQNYAMIGAACALIILATMVRKLGKPIGELDLHAINYRK